MNILFYGAGVLGSLYAARLHDAGQQVSILARGQRLANIRKHGIVLEDGKSREQTTTRVNVVERLDPEDAYDLVVVLMRKNHIAAILPALAANHHTPSILFMGNNAAGPDAMVEALGRERVLLGFPGAGGYHKGHKIIYKIVPGRQQSTTFGELDGSTTPRLQQIVSAFKSAGFPVKISPNMDAWLKTHLAEVSPTANALYMAGGDNYQLARDREGLVLMIRAIREGYRVLQALNVPITPASHKIFAWVPEPILVALWRRMLNIKTAEIEIAGHANVARDEFKAHADNFRALAQLTSVATPAMDRLYTYIESNTPTDTYATVLVGLLLLLFTLWPGVRKLYVQPWYPTKLANLPGGGQMYSGHSYDLWPSLGRCRVVSV